MKTIDTKDWILFSERRNSTNFVSKDGSLMLKASPKDKSFSLQALGVEIRRNAKCFNSNGIIV